MNPEMTELLINKYLDSEITPAEQRLLEAQLQRNPQDRRFLAQLQRLRDQARQLLQDELADRGAPARAIFDLDAIPKSFKASRAVSE